MSVLRTPQETLFPVSLRESKLLFYAITEVASRVPTIVEPAMAFKRCRECYGELTAPCDGHAKLLTGAWNVTFEDHWRFVLKAASGALNLRIWMRLYGHRFASALPYSDAVSVDRDNFASTETEVDAYVKVAFETYHRARAFARVYDRRPLETP